MACDLQMVMKPHKNNYLISQRQKENMFKRAAAKNVSIFVQLHGEYMFYLVVYIVLILVDVNDAAHATPTDNELT